MMQLLDTSLTAPEHRHTRSLLSRPFERARGAVEHPIPKPNAQWTMDVGLSVADAPEANGTAQIPCRAASASRVPGPASGHHSLRECGDHPLAVPLPGGAGTATGGAPWEACPRRATGAALATAVGASRG